MDAAAILHHYLRNRWCRQEFEKQNFGFWGGCPMVFVFSLRRVRLEMGTGQDLVTYPGNEWTSFANYFDAIQQVIRICIRCLNHSHIWFSQISSVFYKGHADSHGSTKLVVLPLGLSWLASAKGRIFGRSKRPFWSCQGQNGANTILHAWGPNGKVEWSCSFPNSSAGWGCFASKV